MGSLENALALQAVWATYSTVILLPAFALTVLLFVAHWKMFQKAGEPGWAIFVPFYSTYVQYKIAYKDGWKMLLLLIPLVNIVVSIQYCFKLAKAFGQSAGFGVGLLFFPGIFIPILGLSKNIQYVNLEN